MVCMKRKIANAFLECSKRKSVDKITVKDLVEECEISRQTFYYHFQDILSVLEWSFEQSMNETLQHCLKAESAEEAITIVVEHGYQRKDMLRRLLQSQKREFVEMTLIRIAEQSLEKLMINKNSSLNMSVLEKDTMLTFYASGIAGVLMKYLLNDNIDSETIAKQIHCLLSDEIARRGRQDA